jgi:hypothetical protein
MRLSNARRHVRRRRALGRPACAERTTGGLGGWNVHDETNAPDAGEKPPARRSPAHTITFGFARALANAVTAGGWAGYRPDRETNV